MKSRTRWYIAGVSVGITVPAAVLMTWCQRVVYGPPDTNHLRRDDATPQEKTPVVVSSRTSVSIDAGAPDARTTRPADAIIYGPGRP